MYYKCAMDGTRTVLRTLNGTVVCARFVLIDRSSLFEPLYRHRYWPVGVAVPIPCSTDELTVLWQITARYNLDLSEDQANAVVASQIAGAAERAAALRKAAEEAEAAKKPAKGGKPAAPAKGSRLIQPLMSHKPAAELVFLIVLLLRCRCCAG